MKKIAAVLVMAALALTGCGEPPARSDQAQSDTDWSGANFKETKVKLKDGRTVLCVVSYREPSCDWEHAK